MLNIVELKEVLQKYKTNVILDRVFYLHIFTNY